MSKTLRNVYDKALSREYRIGNVKLERALYKYMVVFYNK